jgi:hypothetical protein
MFLFLFLFLSSLLATNCLGWNGKSKMQEQNIRRRRKKQEEARRSRDKAWSMPCLLLSSSCSEFVFQLSRELWILLFSQRWRDSNYETCCTFRTTDVWVWDQVLM